MVQTNITGRRKLLSIFRSSSQTATRCLTDKNTHSSISGLVVFQSEEQMLQNHTSTPSPSHPLKIRHFQILPAGTKVGKLTYPTLSTTIAETTLYTHKLPSRFCRQLVERKWYQRISATTSQLYYHNVDL